MAKRIKIKFPNSDDTLEIYDEQLEKYLANGFKLLDNKDFITNKEGSKEFQITHAGVKLKNLSLNLCLYQKKP